MRTEFETLVFFQVPGRLNASSVEHHGEFGGKLQIVSEGMSRMRLGNRLLPDTEGVVLPSKPGW